MEPKLLREDILEERVYQRSIAETAAQKNTLVVLPTGMGKTLISVLVAVERLQKFPESKIAITAPSRPLNAQHKRSFEKFTTIAPEDIVLITGKIRPEEREKLYREARVIAATPQCLKNDLINGRLNFKDFSFITFDETHRATGNYSYTFIAKKYMLQAEHPLILGITASPGSTYSKINEICENLFIKAVEIRGEKDGDVKPYIKPIKKEWIYVELPSQFQRMKSLLEEALEEELAWLREKRFLRTARPSKKLLLSLQNAIASKYMGGSRSYLLMWGMMRLAEAIKFEHAIELLETQGVEFLYGYLKRMERSKKKVDKRILRDPRIREVLKIAEELKGAEHPKLTKMKDLIKDLVEKNSNIKIIVFANYRSTVDRINEIFKNEGVSSEILIGQAMREGRGLSQKEQVEILKRFANLEFNVLITTSIGEEGLDIAATDTAIFYEPVPSAIRTIQRRGRVGRQTAGKIIFLITKGTRDEAYYWAALRKEKKMKGILYDMRKRGVKKEKVTLLDWTKPH